MIRRLLGWWGNPPLAMQILALLIGALMIAQAVTLLLTLVLPPEPPHRYEVSDIAAALRGGPTALPFARRIERGPPDLGERGWLTSASTTARLTRTLGVADDRVVLGFYTQLPVDGLIGTPGPPPGPAPLPPDALPAGAPSGEGGSKPSRLGAVDRHGPVKQPILALAAPVPMGEGQAGRSPGPPGFPPAGRPPMAGGFRFPGTFPGGGSPRNGRSADQPSRIPTQQQPDRAPGSSSTDPAAAGTPPIDRSVRSDGPTGDRNRPEQQTALGARDRAEAQAGNADRLGERSRGDPVLSIERPGSPPPARIVPEPRRSSSTVSMTTAPRPVAAPIVRPAPAHGADEAAIRPLVRDPQPGATATVQSSRPVRSASRSLRPAPSFSVRPVPVVRGGGLFGLSPAPFVEGDFVAALRLPDGRWAVVSPAGEGFPNAWQRRVLLWFALSLLAVAPIAWAFARRIVDPLRGFADAAERLGRDPAAAVLPLDGPAEVGRAAHAFNQMQGRLRGFVDDRTAMIGAISHDLRTPLTRLRFRIEEVPPDQHEGLLGEIVEMEAMIATVIGFMRDASTPSARERRDLAELVGDVVEDAALIGDVHATRVEPAPVDIDALGVRRVLDNLLTNALKYGGGSARVALHIENACAVADIVDDGPGIAEAELERVFEPFYRSREAVESEREGSGLGLAVCRSIARAHGGDVRLFRSPAGFTARVILPLAYDGDRKLAA